MHTESNTPLKIVTLVLFAGLVIALTDCAGPGPDPGAKRSQQNAEQLRERVVNLGDR